MQPFQCYLNIRDLRNGWVLKRGLHTNWNKSKAVVPILTFCVISLLITNLTVLRDCSNLSVRSSPSWITEGNFLLRFNPGPKHRGITLAVAATQKNSSYFLAENAINWSLRGTNPASLLLSCYVPKWKAADSLQYLSHLRGQHLQSHLLECIRSWKLSMVMYR